MAEHNLVGKIGEDVAAKWLIDNGFRILDRNYTKRWGEIDIVARGTEQLHFIEVKTVSHGTTTELFESISRGTWRPEENVHHNKLKRLGRVIETWITEHNLTQAWQIDVLVVRLVPREKYAQVRVIENVILEE